MKGSSTGLMSLKNLDDFHVWPIKHRHWSFELVEDEAHDVWISARDLRSFYARLPKDDVLKTSYQRTSLYAKDVKTLYLSERTMRLELAKSKAYSEHTDVLKFLDWFDRNVSQVAAKKRANYKLDQTNALRDEGETQLHVGPIPAALAPSHLDASTLPMELGEQWRLEQKQDTPQKVFRPEALPVRNTWSSWFKERIALGGRYLISFFTGERNLFLTFGFCLLLATLPGRMEAILLPDSLDWTRSYGRVLWSLVAMMPIALMVAIGIGIALSRSAWSSFKRPGGVLWGGTFYLLTIGLVPITINDHWDQDILQNWWGMVRGRHKPADVYADPELGRVVVRGEFKLGSAEALQFVLDRNPKLTLIEIESPGGLVIEGLRMAQMIVDRKMDTVSMEGCYSACTLLLAGGTDRYLGPSVGVGFHRSGTRYGPVSTGWTASDYKMAEFWQNRGVSPQFIQKALKPSIREIWKPIHGEMYSSGYATLRWSERKTGY